MREHDQISGGKDILRHVSQSRGTAFRLGFGQIDRLGDNSQDVGTADWGAQQYGNSGGRWYPYVSRLSTGGHRWRTVHDMGLGTLALGLTINLV